MTQNINSLSPIFKSSDIKKNTLSENGKDFFDILKESLQEVNNLQIKADDALKNIATGEIKNLHSAAIAIDKAEINMKMMLEIRNKALNAYKEILKTPM